MQQWRSSPSSMTFDEVSMERSKSFVTALQELKNLRPQLNSAADYCENSYLQSEQKQMVLDNLKDYAVRALVNAVDHLGTVAYKLTDLFEQQILDISTVEMKISCMDQKIFTCQSCGNREGLGQLQMPVRTLRHHKHYTLPNSASKSVQSRSQMPIDRNENPFLAKYNSHTPGKFASKTLSWHLASEANSAPNGAPLAASHTRDAKTYKLNSEVFHMLVAEEPAALPHSSSHLQAASGNVTFVMTSNKFGLTDHLEPSKPTSIFKSFASPGRHDIYRPTARNKSMFSAIFTKNKVLKPRKVPVS